MVLPPSCQLAGQTSPCFSCKERYQPETKWTPCDGTYDKLERLDKTDGLINGAAYGEIIDRDLAKDTLGIDNEEATESDTILLNEDTVVARDLHALVGEEGELEVGTETALLAGLGRPGKVSVVGVGRGTCGDGPSD